MMKLISKITFILILFAPIVSYSQDNNSNPFGFRFYDYRPCGGCSEQLTNPNYQPKTHIENPYKYVTNNPIVLDSLKDSVLIKTLFDEPKSFVKDKPVL